jgi:hypothetical protein
MFHLFNKSPRSVINYKSNISKFKIKIIPKSIPNLKNSPNPIPNPKIIPKSIPSPHQ